MDTASRIEETVEKVSLITKTFLVNLHGIWNAMYVMSEDLNDQGEQVILSSLQDFFGEVLVSEGSKKMNLIERVQHKLKECHELQSILKLTPRMEVDTNKPLSSVLDDLKAKLEEIEVVKQERLRLYQELCDIETNLCQALTVDPVIITNDIPLEEDLEKIELHVFQLEEEKCKRFETYVQYRKDIIKLITALEEPLVDEWVHNLMAEQDPAFPLTENSMAKLSEFREEMSKIAESREAIISELVFQVKKLWNRMDVPEGTQQAFLSQLDGIGKSVLNKLHDELRKCQEQRRVMLRPLIAKVREDIVATCNELTFTSDMQKACLQLEEDASEELLDLLENTFDKLQQKLSYARDILELNKKRDQLWQRMEVLEASCQDKNRLFSNRGGKLLKEEKERKAIDLTLPKIQRELINLLKRYQEEMTSPFLFHGRNLLDAISTQWEARLADKENLNAKKKELSKRKADGIESSAKRAKVTHDSVIASSVTRSAPRNGSSRRLTRSQRSGANSSSDKSVFTPTIFTYSRTTAPISSYLSFEEAVHHVEDSAVGLPAAHSSPTYVDNTVSHMPPKTPKTPSRILRTPISVRRVQTPKRQPILRSAAAATLSVPRQQRTPGTPRPRNCALTLQRTPSNTRQNNYFV